jgi:hypothetical protein
MRLSLGRIRVFTEVTAENAENEKEAVVTKRIKNMRTKDRRHTTKHTK